MVAFWILAPVMVVCALGILFTRKAVHCAMLLAVVMIGLAVLYAAQDAPFLFAVQIIVYTGAILMLFLFVLMLVGVDASDSLVETIRGQRVVATLLGLVFALVLVLGIAQVYVGSAEGLTQANADGNVQGLARVLFTRYVLAFEVTSALLITAALGAMVLAHRERLSPKVGQADLAARRMQEYVDHGRHLGPLPPPGTFARSNAIDTPALLPDGTQAPGSVSRVLVARGNVNEPPHDVDEISLEIAGGVPGHGESASSAEAQRTSSVATRVRETLPDDYPGSVQPLDDGTEPEGHPVKGNKASMLFHEPGGRWYDVTVAQVWFSSAEAAEAAGFSRAGRRKKEEG